MVDVLPPPAPLLEMRGIVKTYPGVQALRGVDLTLQPGEALALLGENGAGKSTLMKVLGGAITPDAGEIRVDGALASFRQPRDAEAAGIAVIYQEFNLVPALTAAENIHLGREQARFGFVARREEHRHTRELFERLGVEIDPGALCRDLTVAQQQLVEIAKALAVRARILVMDEPSAALTVHEVERLFTIIRELKKQGIGVIYISHRLEEIFAACDRVTVLRDGANAGDAPVKEITRAALIQRMVGRELKDEFPPRPRAPGQPRLSVRGLTRAGVARNVSFEVRAGEILALTGLIGAGRTETARLIFGADVAEAGEVWLDGKRLDVHSPRDAIRAGICLLTEDRKHQGLVLLHSVRENFGLPNLDWLSHGGFVEARRERESFGRLVQSLRIRIPHQEQAARNLSGGNQQKVVLAKWLARNCDVLIFDEPTRGVDVGAKFEIYQLMNELVAQGKAIVMISSELPEVLGMADRIVVMHEGRVTGEIADARIATQESIMELAVA
jgi:ABC-type sugar transport system ATPase subunit